MIISIGILLVLLVIYFTAFAINGGVRHAVYAILGIPMAFYILALFIYAGFKHQITQRRSKGKGEQK